MTEVRAEVPRVSRRLAALMFLLPALAACGSSSELKQVDTSLPLVDPFVAVERDEVSQVSSALSADPQLAQLSQALRTHQKTNSFYLAIRKDELGKRFFLTSFLRQFHPNPVPGLAPLSTRVVSFEVQNDQVIVFDREDRHHSNGTYKPQIIIDAYPVVKNHGPFSALLGSSDYVLFDPAAGRNEFSVLGTIRGSGSSSMQDSGIALKTHATFLQAFRRVSDGITFEKVFGATMETAEGDLYNYAGTLGIGLRRYSEGEGFERLPYPDNEYFFSSLPHRVPNTGELQVFATKWNIKKGMKPIEWLLSPELVEIQKQPEYANYDLIGAVKRGAEAWNKAFGFEVIRARVATPEENEGQDDTNFLIVDRNPAAGYAMGLLRNNPNTGEIRGANIYIGSGMLDGILGAVRTEEAPSDTTETSPVGLRLSRAGTPKSEPLPARPQLTWNKQSHAALCELQSDAFAVSKLFRSARVAFAAEAAQGEEPAKVALSPQEQFERMIGWIVMHEVGHTLGLRHNFKGSLTSPVSSVMDYFTAEDQASLVEPGAYDREAIAFLYGNSGQLPTQPFCTDGGQATDPNCTQFDSGTDPFNQVVAPTYELVKKAWLGGNDSAEGYVVYFLDEMLRYHLANTDDAASVQTYNLILGGLRPPLAPELVASSPDYANRADLLSYYVLNKLYGEGTRPQTRALAYEVLTDFGAILENADGIRTIDSRFLAVDTLKKFQLIDAHAVLLMGSEAVNTQRATAKGEKLSLLNDLALRIEKALTPYFN